MPKENIFSDDEEQESNQDWKSYILRWDTLAVILLGIFILVENGKLGPVNWDKATTYGFLGIAGVWIANTSWIAMKHKTAKIVFNPGFSTTDGEFQTVGNFALFRLGSVKAFNMYYKGSEGTLCCPLDAVNKIGRSIAIKVRAEQCDISALPREVRGVVSQYGYKEPYYFGLADEEQYDTQLTDSEGVTGLNKPNVSYLIQMVKELNQITAFLDNIMSGKFHTVEEIVAAGSRIRERAEGGGLKKALEKMTQEPKNQ